MSRHALSLPSACLGGPGGASVKAAYHASAEARVIARASGLQPKPGLDEDHTGGTASSLRAATFVEEAGRRRRRGVRAQPDRSRGPAPLQPGRAAVGAFGHESSTRPAARSYSTASCIGSHSPPAPARPNQASTTPGEAARCMRPGSRLSVPLRLHRPRSAGQASVTVASTSTASRTFRAPMKPL